MISFCIFGSRARGTSDRFSDFDLLLTGQHEEQLEAVAGRWERRGWNVSAYQISELRSLAGKKSLFLQHIKKEGRIVHDKTGQLKGVLDTYVPRLSYVPQRNDAIKQILALPKPGNDVEVNACLVDIACVLFRNFAILHLASRQIYEFDQVNLINLIANEFCFDETIRKSLIMLRSAKHAYRNRLHADSSVILLSNVNFATSCIAERIGDLTESAIGSGTHSDLYIRLRQRELELIAEYGVRYLDALPRKDPLCVEWLGIRRYRSYPKDKISLN